MQATIDGQAHEVAFKSALADIELALSELEPTWFSALKEDGI